MRPKKASLAKIYDLAQGALRNNNLTVDEFVYIFTDHLAMDEMEGPRRNRVSGAHVYRTVVEAFKDLYAPVLDAMGAPVEVYDDLPKRDFKELLSITLQDGMVTAREIWMLDELAEDLDDDQRYHAVVNVAGFMEEVSRLFAQSGPEGVEKAFARLCMTHRQTPVQGRRILHGLLAVLEGSPEG